MKKTILQFAAISAMLVMLNSETKAQWLTTGNALGATGSLGSTTNFDLSLITNNASRMYITKLGNVGIGTNAPAFLLDVFSAGNASANFKSSTGTANLIIDRGNSAATSSVSYRTAGVPTWQTGTLSTNNFVIRNVALGKPALTFLATNNNIGVGTPSPETKLHISGGNYDLFNSQGDVKIGDATYSLRMGVALAGGGSGDAYVSAVGGTNTLYLGGGSSYAGTQLVSINGSGRVGIGTGAAVPGAKLDVLGNSSGEPVVNIANSVTGINVDVRGISLTSVTNPGYGIGAHLTGGYIGVLGVADATTYSGSAYGIYGAANGTAGDRYGIYGVASGSGGVQYAVYGNAYGGTDNWGGYFPTKTYTSELRVGGTQGATGYVAAINGKLIATEVRVDLQSAWPDYVFSKEHNLMSIDDLEESININKHLPGIPSACEMEESGIMLGEMQIKTMEKVEELTLYLIQLKKENDALKNRIEVLEKK